MLNYVCESLKSRKLRCFFRVEKRKMKVGHALFPLLFDYKKLRVPTWTLLGFTNNRDEWFVSLSCLIIQNE